jgi:Trk-type K+ transport system membrane component
MTVSAITTTGFSIANIQTWASVTILFLAMLVFIGGASGSTSGGIKLHRVMLAVRALLWWFRRLFLFLFEAAFGVWGMRSLGGGGFAGSVMFARAFARSSGFVAGGIKLALACGKR